MSVTTKLKDFSDMLDTPLVRIAGKAFFLGLLALALYAGRSYLHESISGDQAVIELRSDAAAAKALIASHDTFIREQGEANTRLSDFFRESRQSRDDMAKQLAAIIQHGADQDQRLLRIENKIDSQK